MKLSLGVAVLLLLLSFSPISGVSSEQSCRQIEFSAGEVGVKDVLVIQPGPAEGKDTTIYCPNTNYDYCNDGARYNIQTNEPYYPNKMLIEFPLSAIPSNAAVLSATVDLCLEGYIYTDPLSIGAYRIKVPWVEGTGNRTVTNDGANWYTRDGSTSWSTPGMGAGTDYDATPVSTVSVSTGSWYSWNVTSLVQGWRAGTYPNYGIVFAGTTTVYGGNPKAFFSSDYSISTYRPKLTVSYVIDTTPPVTTASLTGTYGENNWFIGPVTLTLSATDPYPSAGGTITTYYSVNNGSYIPYTAQVPFSAEGVYYVKYYSVDGCGNQESEKSISFGIDTSPPLTSHTFTGTGGYDNWYSGDVVCTLNGTDATSGVASIYYSVDSGSEVLYTSPFVINTPGTHTIRYYGKDYAGNIESPHSTELKIDNDMPTTSHTLTGTIGYADYYVSDVVCTLNGSDPTSGLDKILYKIDSGAENVYAGPFIITGDGIHTLSYYGVDYAGNTESMHSVQVKIDASAPTSSLNIIGTAGENGWYCSDVSVEITVTDGGSQVNHTYYRINGGSWQVYSSPFKLSQEGRYTLEYYSVDFAGNVEKTKVWDFGIDKTPPTTTWNVAGTYEETGWYISSVTLTLRASDSASGVAGIFYSVNNGTYNQYSSALSFSDGIYYIRLYAKDAAGNKEGEKVLLLKIDTTPPSIAHILPEPTGKNGWYVNDVVFEVNATDSLSGLAGIYYSLNAGEEIAYTGAVTISKEGYTNVSYWAIDNAGHRSEGYFEIWLDKTPPEITVNITGKSGKNGWFTSATTVKIEGKDAFSGVESIYYKINGGSSTKYNSSFVLKEDGKYNLTVYAVDYAGNEAKAKNFYVKIDSRPPVLSHEPVKEWLYLEELEISAECADENAVTIVALYYRVGNVDTWESIEMTPKDGKYTASISKEEMKLDGIDYYIVAEDEAGNQAVLPYGAPKSTPYHVNVHINYWYLIILVLILLMMLILYALVKRRRAMEGVTHGLASPEVPACPICNFPIRPGADAYKCPTCGTITHANCIIRNKTCPKCGLPMQVVVEKAKIAEKAKQKEICGICVYPLEPGDEAYRCTCGAIYHGKCILELKYCPACKKEIKVM